MYLRDVMVLPASGSKNDIGVLRGSCDHVIDILRHYLPEKYELGGLRRVVINLGRGDVDELRQYYDGGGGVGYYAAPDFDMQSYFSLSNEEQEEKVIECIEKSLLDLARRLEAPTAPLELAIRNVRESEFRLDTKLACSRSHPSRRFRVLVIRRFAPGGVFVRYEIRNKAGVLMHSDEVLSGAWIVTVNYEFCKSRWNGGTLEILDRSGKMVAVVPCGAYIAP